MRFGDFHNMWKLTHLERKEKWAWLMDPESRRKGKFLCNDFTGYKTISSTYCRQHSSLSVHSHKYSTIILNMSVFLMWYRPCEQHIILLKVLEQHYCHSHLQWHQNTRGLMVLSVICGVFQVFSPSSITELFEDDSRPPVSAVHPTSNICPQSDE